MPGKIFKAKVAFWYYDDNEQSVLVPAGSTVREGHPLLKGREELFVEHGPDFEHGEPERATESEPVETARDAVEEQPTKRGPGRPRKNP